MEENQHQAELTGDSTASSLAASPPKRDTRRSTRLLTDKKQPDSTHEADVSESESCCSVVSDVQATPRTRRRTVVREKRTEQDEVSEAESCSSTVSATHSRRAPRSLRKRVLTSAASKDAEKVDEDDPSGAESCSSAVSITKVTDTHRITRSHRKTAVPTTEADPQSCSSSVSSLRGSVVRRSARNPRVKLIEPIPLSLEETTDTPSSPVPRNLRDRRRKTGAEDDEYDSDGCKSGPSMSPWRSTRRQAKLKTESDSESVATDVCTSHGSPSPQRGRGTPCSSRTGSASSARAVPVTRTRSKARLTSDTATAMPEEKKEGEEHELHHKIITIPDGDKAEDTADQLDSTMTMDTSEAQECTIIEEKAEDTTIVLDQDEPVEMLEPQSSMQDIKPVEDRGTETLTPQEEPVAESSVTLTEDREEPGDVSMENNEPEFVDQTCTEPVVEGTVEAAAEDSVPALVEEIIEDQRCSEPVKKDTVEAVPQDLIPVAVEEHEEMAECEKKGVIVTEEATDIKTTEVDSVTLDLEGPSTSSHTYANLTTTVETSKEPPPQKEMISLLDSSEDEDSADESLSLEEEGCSQEAEDEESEEHVMCHDGNWMSEEAEPHGSGLFVIDTRPGRQPNKQYYVEAKQTEEEEEDEDDFVDEEGEDDEDADSKVLFAPRKPLYVFFYFLLLLYW